jgi:hypothetical protein
MLDDRVIRAARNNAKWCDAVCRSHGNPGEFHDDMWLNRHPVPRFYPNAGTLAEPSEHQLDLIGELMSARLPRGWAIKDSFYMLDLASRGFQRLFAAEWIYLPSSKVKQLAAAEKAMRWEVVRSDRALTEWESAFSRSAGDDCEDKIFVPPLLEDKEIAVVAGHRDGDIVAGAIGNRSDGVVGWSNVFAPKAEMLVRAAESIATIARIFPELPIVGYEHGDDLRNAHALTFESIGPLRVWTFQS